MILKHTNFCSKLLKYIWNKNKCICIIIYLYNNIKNKPALTFSQIILF